MIISKNNKFILKGILIFSIFSLSAAYFIQYILGHKPCNLCLIERYPYLGAIIFISLFFIINRYEKVLLFSVLLLFIFGAVISFYHVGIEQNFFQESAICDVSNSLSNLQKEDLLKELKNTAPISCKNVTFRIFGFSLATINTVISMILSGIMIKILFSYDKNK